MLYSADVESGENVLLASALVNIRNRDTANVSSR